jgi:undecaprenyl-diphosphatase
MKRNVGKIKRENSISLIFSLIFLCLFIITLISINLGFFQKTDEFVNSYFSTSFNAFLVNFYLIISFIFDPLSVIVICFILSTLLFFKKLKKEALFLMASSLLGGILIFVVKELVQRVRPENLYEFGFSFPSGHATISIILFCNLIYFSSRYTKKNYFYSILAFSMVLLFLVDFSRIYIGVHWFSDIVGGIFLGLFTFLCTIYLFEN